MDTICFGYFKTKEITDDEEDIVIDYLSDNNIEVTLDMNSSDICKLALEHKYNKPIDSILVEPDTMSYNIIDYGDLDINTYLNIALISDDRTLLNMMLSSKSHMAKFDDMFFKKYLNKHYPELVKYRPMHISYKEYYLTLIGMMDILQRNYNIDTTLDKDYITIYNNIKRIEKGTPFLLDNYIEKI